MKAIQIIQQMTLIGQVYEVCFIRPDKAIKCLLPLLRNHVQKKRMQKITSVRSYSQRWHVRRFRSVRNDHPHEYRHASRIHHQCYTVTHFFYCLWAFLEY